jgi:hypothetical protein
VVGAVKGRVHGFQEFGVVAVEIVAAETIQGQCLRLLRVHARIPVVTAEDLVGALAALHHLDAARHLFREQVEGDRVLAHHGFGHLVDGFRQARQHLVVGDVELVVAGGEMRGDGVGIFEFVAAFLRLVLESDGEGHQVFHALFSQQGHQQAGIEAAGEQYAHLDVGDQQAFLYRRAQGVVDGFAPFRFAQGLVRTLSRPGCQ